MCDLTLPMLRVEPFDPVTDTIVIEGVRYSGRIFRNLAADLALFEHSRSPKTYADEGALHEADA